LSFGSGCGIYVPYSAYNKIVNNTIRDVNTHGILIGEISHGNDVINNTISNAGAHGVVVFHYTGATTITGNNITDVGGRGITIESVCNDAIITNNTITNAGQQGIFLWNGDRATVSRNIVYNSTGYGIELHTESNDDEVIWNSFIQNNESGTQAYDNGTNNIFSYNYWDDWTSPDNDNDGFIDNPFVITGPANNADPLPRTDSTPRPQSIVINGPNDFAIPYGKPGYSLTWTVTVTYHESYTVYRNGTIITMGSRGFGNWTDTILISLDGLAAGLHNFTLIILDSYSMNETHTVWVTVKEPDVTPPTINSPDDLSFEEGSIGYSITWVGSDEHPWRAVILLNNTPVYNESWAGENIIARLDPIDLYPQALTAGVHNFTCILYDWEGRQTKDSVLVVINPHVPDIIPPIITAPDPLEYVEGTVGNYLTWNASDDHPKVYEWFVNETKIGYYPWHGGEFNISVDYISVGTWNITVTVFDLSGNNATASTVIIVIPIPPDETPPSVSSPAPLEIYENSVRSIVWEVSDDYPYQYVIYRNSSTVVKQGYWTTGIIQYSLSNLTVNTWEFNLTVWDESGNWNSSTVIVVVLPGGETESAAPVIAQMPDMSIQFGTSGNSATFRVFDEHPGYVEVYLNNLMISHLPWIDPNQKVMVSLDGLVIGTHNLTLVAWDIFGNSASRSITVQITGDNDPPVLSSPDSISVSSSESASITWTTSDENLAYYEIFVVYINGTEEELQTDALTGKTSEDIEFTFTEFPEGEYTIRLIVYDTAGHRVIDDVLVIVKPSKGQSSPGFELLPFMIILLMYTISRKPRRKRDQDQLRRNKL
ncbi:MAG: right-handed parallel beta-helix repeat-containing protein, partial [Candidatus Heimdallarchaeota archaeon]